MTNSPSLPHFTSSGGIPAIDVPCRASCRFNLTGSAPSRREPGRCRVAGSTSKNSLAGIPPSYHQSPTAALPLHPPRPPQGPARLRSRILPVLEHLHPVHESVLHPHRVL